MRPALALRKTAHAAGNSPYFAGILRPPQRSKGFAALRRFRRRRSAMSLSPRAGLVLLAGSALALVAAFFFLLGEAEDAKPIAQEKRIELPDAFK
jgi:hypothetical protein